MAPTTIVAARLNCIICDEMTLAELTLCKGNGGHKPCLLCASVILNKYYHVFAGTDWPVPSTTADKSKIKLHTATSVRGTLDKLAALKDELSKRKRGFRGTTWTNLQQARDVMGPFAVDIASAVMFDWVHIYMVSGQCHGINR